VTSQYDDVKRAMRDKLRQLNDVLRSTITDVSLNILFSIYMSTRDALRSFVFLLVCLLITWEVVVQWSHNFESSFTSFQGRF